MRRGRTGWRVQAPPKSTHATPLILTPLSVAWHVTVAVFLGSGGRAGSSA